MEALSRLVQRLPRSRLVAGVLVALSILGGYLFAGWVSGPRDTTQLAHICARVDYVNSLQQALPQQQAAGEEVRNEFAMLVEQCRLALGNSGEESG